MLPSLGFFFMYFLLIIQDVCFWPFMWKYVIFDYLQNYITIKYGVTIQI